VEGLILLCVGQLKSHTTVPFFHRETSIAVSCATCDVVSHVETQDDYDSSVYLFLWIFSSVVQSLLRGLFKKDNT
jgi:hypothetical protein